MKMKRIVTLTAVIITAITVSVVSMGCARDAAIRRSLPIRTEPAQRPDWVDSVPPDTPTTKSFIGSAGRYATATGNTGARYFAEANGRQQLVSFYGTQIRNAAQSYSATYGLSSDILDPVTLEQEFSEWASQNVAQGLYPRNYYTEVYLDSSNRDSYEVYVLMEIDRALVTQVIDNYGREQAEAFAKRVEAEQNTVQRQLLQRAVEFFGGNLSTTLGL